MPNVSCQRMPTQPRAYLDTCVVRDRVELRRKETTLPHLLLTLQHWNEGNGDIDLVTSQTMKAELQNIKPEDLAIYDFAQYVELYDRLGKVPYVSPAKPGQVSYVDGGRGGMTQGGIVEEPEFAELRQILGLSRRHWNDADHLAQAIIAQINYFITVDYNSILNKRQEVERAFPTIKLGDPTEFVREMGW